MNPLTVNETTGFLESRSPHSKSFSSAKKLRFLELANEMAERRENPSLPKLFEAVGVDRKTFYEHLKVDEVFAEAWEEVQDKIEDALVGTMVMNGQRPSGFMDRIAWLKANRGSKWNLEHKVQISDDHSSHKKIIEGLHEIVDAEIVKPAQLTGDIVDKPVDKEIKT